MTRTYVTLFNPADVDESVGAAYQKLESDFEARREYITEANARAIESRLTMLRAVWMLLLDRAVD